jgi:hypothetical protein
MSRSAILLFLALTTHAGLATPLRPESGAFMLPLNCSELLPDTAPFLNFFEAVGKGAVAKNRRLAKRIFKIMALRERLAEIPDRAREQNPIDTLIRKTLCFYREQKEPLSPVGYDDAAFVAFLKGSLPDLEEKIDKVIYQSEYDRQQRKEYERQLERNQGVVLNLRREADLEADQSFERITNRAKRKVRTP